MGNGLHQRLSESEGKLRREQVERTAGVEGRTQQTENVQRRTSNAQCQIRNAESGNAEDVKASPRPQGRAGRYGVRSKHLTFFSKAKVGIRNGVLGSRRVDGPTVEADGE